MHQRDLRGQHRLPAHETLGAVERIDQPQPVAFAATTLLLAIDGVIGKIGQDDLADGAFGGFVDFGNRRLIGLDAHADIGAALLRFIAITDDVGSRLRRALGGVQCLVQIDVERVAHGVVAHCGIIHCRPSRLPCNSKRLLPSACGSPM